MSSPFHHEKRKQPSARERAELLAAADERCANCGRKIRIGEEWDLADGEIDHELALAKGGTNEPSNLRVLCELCHGAKTSVDLSEASKMKRTYIRQRVPAKYRNKSRSFGRWKP